jgi:hypothetical protein
MLTRRTSAETAARFRASYERRRGKVETEPRRRRQLGAIVAACRAAGRLIPMWVRVQLFAQRGAR